jgi:hypothetical protein
MSRVFFWWMRNFTKRMQNFISTLENALTVFCQMIDARASLAWDMNR